MQDFLPIRKLYHCDEIFAYPKASIQKATEHFGKLPKMLIEYYRQLGTSPEMDEVQTYLCSPDSLVLENGYLTFYDEAIMICEDEDSCQISFACTTEYQFEQIKKHL